MLNFSLHHIINNTNHHCVTENHFRLPTVYFPRIIFISLQSNNLKQWDRSANLSCPGNWRTDLYTFWENTFMWPSVNGNVLTNHIYISDMRKRMKWPGVNRPIGVSELNQRTKSINQSINHKLININMYQHQPLGVSSFKNAFDYLWINHLDLILLISVPFHCNFTERSDQHSLQSVSCCEKESHTGLE